MQEAGLPENLEDAKKRVRDSKSSSEGYAFIGDATDIRYQVRILYHMALEFFHNSSRILLSSASLIKVPTRILNHKKVRSIYLLRLILLQLKFGLSEKHTKFEKIFLMVWMFTKFQA